MKNFVVGILDFFSNNLTVHYVEADGWNDALMKAEYERHMQEISDADDDMLDHDFESWIKSLDGDIDSAKSEYFDGDRIFDVKEI